MPTLKDDAGTLDPLPIEKIPQRAIFMAAEMEAPKADLALEEIGVRIQSDADGANWSLLLDTRTQYSQGTITAVLDDCGLTKEEQAELRRMLIVVRDNLYERNGLVKQ
jgi:hypothetical protein